MFFSAECIIAAAFEIIMHNHNKKPLLPTDSAHSHSVDTTCSEQKANKKQKSDPLLTIGAHQQLHETMPHNNNNVYNNLHSNKAVPRRHHHHYGYFNPIYMNLMMLLHATCHTVHFCNLVIPTAACRTF